VILAALDPFHAHARPADLDGRLLSAATHFAQLLHGSVHVFHAYMPVINVEPASLSVVPLTLLPPEAEETHREQIVGVIKQMAKSDGIPESRCHVKMGDVVAQLSAATQRTRAGLVVMGAVSRTALARLFVGNTAERALDRLSCDVLVVKPRGFALQVARRFSGRPARRSMSSGTRAPASLRPRTGIAPIRMLPLL
jgi:universal stress protein E